jgi:catechol 2,3-dioxygenase-like lactoylglutathione lyase family enzyme
MTDYSEDGRSAVVRGLGEVVIRVKDLDRMQEFYQRVVGLQLIRRFENMAFLRIADGYQGHTQIVGLFRESIPAPLESLSRDIADAQRTTLHHFAVEISLEDYDAQVRHLHQLGLLVQTVTHPWIGWRSIYVADPEGNALEFVCFDRTVLEGQSDGGALQL